MSEKHTERKHRPSRAYAFLVVLLLLSLVGGAFPPQVRAVAVPDVASEQPASIALAPQAAPAAPAVVSRSEFSRTEYDPREGVYTLVSTERPQFWLDRESGDWKQFRDSLRASAAPGQAYENAEGPFRVSFGGPGEVAAGRPMLRFSANGGSVGVSMPGVAPAGLRLHAGGKALTYQGLLPGVDARLTLDRERLKEELILASAPTAPLTFSWNLELSGVQASKRADGSVAFADASGRTLFEMPAPFMLDAAGDSSGTVAVTLAQAGPNRARLTYAPDMAWLRSPGRAYPVVVDPSLKAPSLGPKGQAGRNVSIDEAYPTINYDGRPTLVAGKYADGRRNDFLLRFASLDRMPADSTIISAQLRLYAASGATGVPVEVHRNTTEWDPATATWENRPASTYTGFVWDTTASAVPGWNSFDVTGLARGWLARDYPAAGMRLLSTGANGAKVGYHSSYYTDPACADCMPELRLRYVTASRTGLNGMWPFAGGVNTTTGNKVLRNSAGAIPARGFDVSLTHTYNSQDDYGLSSGYIGSAGGAVYGEQWSFSQSARLYEIDGGNAVVYRDGAGDSSRVFVKDADNATTGVRSYIAPLRYGLTLTKDIKNPPAAASEVWTLTPRASRVRHHFDAEGRRTRVEDDNGNYLSYLYDLQGRLVRITDVANRATALEYAGVGGRLSKITDMAGRQHTYAYDAGGNLTGVTHAAGTADAITTTYTYGSGNQVTSVTDPKGNTSHIRYDSLYNWDAAGATEGWTPINADQTTVAQSADVWRTPPGSLKVTMTSVTSSQVSGAEIRYPAARSLSTVPQELVAWVHAPAGSQLEGRLVLRHNDGYSSASAYQGLVSGWNVLRFEAAQVETGLQAHQMEVNVRPQAGAAAFTGSVYIDYVFLKGVVDSLTDAKPTPVTTLQYRYHPGNSYSEVLSLDDGGVYRASRHDYNGYGQLTKGTDPLGNFASYEYDSEQRLTRVVPPGDAQGTAGTTDVNIGYHPGSNVPRTTTNEAGETGRQGVDTRTGDVRYAIDSRNEARRLHRDAAGNPDQSYVATIYKRDAAGNPTRVETNRYAAGTDLEAGIPADTDPRRLETLRAWGYTYASGGRVASMTDARGATTRYRYADPATGVDPNTGYVREIESPAGQGETTPREHKMDYAADGQLRSSTDPRGKRTEYAYDGRGWLRGARFGAGGATSEFSHSYTLDDNGNVTATADDAGGTSYTYDENDQLTAESRAQNGVTRGTGYSYYPNGQLRQMGATSYAYDAAGRLATQTDPYDGGRTIGYGYDGRSRLKSIAFPSGARQELSYGQGRVELIALRDPAGALIQKHDYDYASGGQFNSYVKKVTELDGSVTDYRYDDLDRLVGATRTGTSPYTQSYAYDDNDNRTSVTRDGVTTTTGYDAANQVVGFDYDRAGNLLSGGGTTYTYDAASRTAAVTTAEGTRLSFGYDAGGRRVSRTDPNYRTDYWYDASGLVREDRAPPPGTQMGDSRHVYLRAPGGMLLTRADICGAGCYGEVRNYAHDRQGSVTALHAGGLSGTYGYDPYGRPNGGTLSAQGGGGATAPHNPWRYHGTYLDGASDLYQMGARYYDAGQGRFAQQDPVDGWSYHYGGSNPVNYSDPTGLVCTAVGGSVNGVGLQARSSTCLQGSILPSGENIAGRLVGRSTRSTSGSPGTYTGNAYAHYGGCSFSKDTVVVTTGSKKRIGDVRVGDWVLAYDEETGKTRRYKVTAVWAHEDPEVEYLTIGGERIETTPDHPFYTLERGWVEAGRLELGERVRKADGGWGPVDALRVIKRRQMMYDLTVAGPHTYFVGDGQWLVHNCGAKARIHSGRQGKHIPGHNNFDPSRGRSELTHPDPQALLDRGMGTGVRYSNKEVVDFGETIGTWVSPTGTRSPTTRGTIHYDSRGNAHIVPSNPSP